MRLVAWCIIYKPWSRVSTSRMADSIHTYIYWIIRGKYRKPSLFLTSIIRWQLALEDGCKAKPSEKVVRYHPHIPVPRLPKFNPHRRPFSVGEWKMRLAGHRNILYVHLLLHYYMVLSFSAVCSPWMTSVLFARVIDIWIPNSGFLSVPVTTKCTRFACP